MKNKKLLSILIPAVVIVWGSIIYKVVEFYLGNADQTEFKNEMVLLNAPSVFPDTFSLILNYPDPFLSTEETKFISKKQISTSLSPSKKENTLKQATQYLNWPEIKYGGLIRNKSNAKVCGFVKIGAMDYVMSAGDTKDEVCILTLYRDSIKVSYKNTFRTIKK